VHELAVGVESLYRDQLRPYGRILRKRLAELTQAAGRGELEMGVKELHAACTTCPWLQLEDPEGADWAVLLVGRPDCFIDVYSPKDLYPESMWFEASVYFVNLTDAQMVLPGGRYSCAQVLMSRNLPCLAGRTLGEVCHIVQLAISQKKILGYLNGTVVPYGRSQSMVKERHAVCQQPCAAGAGASRSRGPVASWAVLRASLQDLLKEVASNGQPIPLSNIKRLFRSKFHIELSETALGYAKVSELLQDSRLSDLCEVKLQGHGYVITTRQEPKARPKRNLISLADSLCMGKAEEEEDVGAAFLDETPNCAGLLGKRAGFVKPSLCMDTIFMPEGGASPAREAATAHAAWLLSTPVQTPFPPTPSPCAAYTTSLPRLLGGGRYRQSLALFNDGFKGAAVASGYGVAAVTAVVQGKTFGDASMVPPPPPPAVPPQLLTALVEEAGVPYPRRTWVLPPLTPSTMGILSSVHNTFIHAALPPPTPVKSGARGRARSLPRDSY